MKIAKLTLTDLAATKRLGLFLANQLMVGDVLALQGALGAGKSELARAIIQQVCPDETDIPSPTFTLVQAYESDDNGSLLHFDLYRLAEPGDVFELGIEDAFVEAVCLIEWPERLAGYLPDHALFRIFGEAEIMPNVTLFGTIANLFDANWYANSYSQLWVQPGAPRTATLGFRAGF